MRRSARLFSSLLFLLAISTTASAGRLAEPMVEYSAETMTITGGLFSTGKVYHAPYMERREERAPGKEQVTITRMDKLVVWLLMPGEKTYIEIPVRQAMERSQSPEDLDYQYTRLGPELINGIITIKSRMEAVGQNGTVYEGYIWVTGEGILLKMVSRERGRPWTEVSTELQGLKIGPQPRSLFEVPKGYKLNAGPGGFGGPWR
ncbi:MAG: hypothetical protein HY889_01415 [Deltaproteobacteria bacterium]|nr:hypothetical protein [Deltaproteobacteria bacterium]